MVLVDGRRARNTLQVSHAARSEPNHMDGQRTARDPTMTSRRNPNATRGGRPWAGDGEARR